MKQVKKIGIFFAAILLLVAGLSCFAGCEKKWKWFTEEQHLERVRKRVEERYMGEGSEYTSFEVFPVYNEYDELAYFVVDFQPQGYLYIELNKDSIWTSMYMLDDTGDDLRYPYTIKQGNECVLPDKDGNERLYVNREVKKDSDGNYICYRVSHYRAAGVQNEKRYLLKIRSTIELGISTGLIPAVKRNGTYINLISMEEMEYTIGMESAEEPISDISFIPKSYFNL